VDVGNGAGLSPQPSALERFSDQLLTAPTATDAMTRQYRQHLADSDGPAFLSLFLDPCR
jgi:hypothetical protein